jgi:hypothetical protein
MIETFGDHLAALLRKEAAQPAHAADCLIECLVVACLVCASHQFLSGRPFHPAAADARAVRQPVKCQQEY